MIACSLPNDTQIPTGQVRCGPELQSALHHRGFQHVLDALLTDGPFGRGTWESWEMGRQAIQRGCSGGLHLRQGHYRHETLSVCKYGAIKDLFIYSLAPRKFELNFRHVILIWVIDGWGISCEIALIWMSLDFTDDQSTLVPVMAWCRQATSHYLSQCWPRSLSIFGVTRPQWVKSLRPGAPFTNME